MDYVCYFYCQDAAESSDADSLGSAGWPKKRKQNAIGTPKKSHQIADDIIIFDKLTKSHCTCTTAQQVDRDISECEGGAAKTCCFLDEHVG